MYKKIKHNAYNLHIIKEDKFKNTVITVSFKNKNSDKSLIERRLIKDILFESNSIYSTKRLLKIETEKLYDLDIYSEVLNLGNSIITSFNLSILNEKYAPGLFEDSIKFISNIIFKPKNSDNKFDEKAFKKAIIKLNEDIDLYYENPTAYAMDDVLKKIGGNSPLSYSCFGDTSYLKKVKNDILYKAYLDMLKNDKIDIFIVGNVPSNVTKIISKYFKLDERILKCDSYIKHTEFNNKLKEIKCVKPYNQSTLILGYKLSDLTSYERQYVLPIYSHILGGGPDSKLFKNVREKNSLCYSIGCSYRIVSNVLFITSFIDAKDYKKTVKLIKEQVSLMSDGKFSKEDISNAKLAYLAAYESSLDSPFNIISDYTRKEYLNTDLISRRKRKIMKVSKKDILNIIPKIHPEIVYLLEGSKQ